MNRKKKQAWYRNPYLRFIILAAALVVMIIVLVVVLNRKGDGETAASSARPQNLLETGTNGTGAAGDIYQTEDGTAGSTDGSVDGSNAGQGAAESTGTDQSGVQDGQTDVADPAAVGVDPAAGTEGTDPAAGLAGGTDASAGVPVAAQAEDGTGAAGIMAMDEVMLLSSSDTGWHFNDYYTWYSTSPGMCYYNGWQDIDGATYHFDSAGHLDLGWKLIGGTSCYFDDNGVYQPGADNSKLLAFTFDDGPSEGTDALLELCSQTGARVTFFMIGRQVENGGAVIPYIVKYRCQLGNHSYTHSDMYKKSVEECVEDFTICDNLIRQYSGGIGADVVRFPYGDQYDEQVAAVGKASIFWDVDTFDWQTRDVASIKQEVYDTISEGNIILMHDRYEESVQACRELFPELIAQGYQLVTISELAAAKGIDLANGGGVTYYNFRG